MYQLDLLVQQYESEMGKLKQSQEEQKKDIHSMIQALNIQRDEKNVIEKQLEDKILLIEQMKIKYDIEKNEMKSNNQAEINKLILEIDRLTKKIEDLDY